jgi:DNA-binding transcriptional ArsR family regulator
MAAADQIAALGDPSRRLIFDVLSRGPAAVGDIAQHVPVTRSAVSQHLKVLKDVGLVQAEVKGTRRVYRIDPDGVAEMRAYLDDVWRRALDNFKAEAERRPARRRVKGRDHAGGKT